MYHWRNDNMKKIKIIDDIGGHVHISKSKNKYFKTKDSASPSGHSLLAQIDMTHSGIVTRNYGFYLPARMKAGAHTFTKDYNKPVLIGHDEEADTKPVGRVIHAEYIDSSDVYKSKDSYLKGLFQFQDSKNRGEVLDFVHHVIKNYDAKDGYKGLGHIRGTVKITDAEVIQGILDETYLTVSTSMVSDSATCSICGTDWVADGLCDHRRGQVYDDDVCVVIPGSMAYDHLGIVNTPADPHAHDFTIISDNPTEKTILQIDRKLKDLYKTNDHYDIAAQLFACKDDSIISLSSETDVNLIEIKDNIQKMENIMKNKKSKEDLKKKIQDEMSICVSVYRFGNDETGSKEVSVREMVKELSAEEINAIVEHIIGMMESEKSTDNSVKAAVKKYFDDNYEAVAEAPTEPAKGETKDQSYKGAMTQPTVGAKTSKKKSKKKAKKMSDSFKLEDSEEITEEMFDEVEAGIAAVEGAGLNDSQIFELTELVCLYRNEDAIALATFGKIEANDFAGFVAKYKELKDSAIVLDKAQGEEIYEEMKKHMDTEKALTDEQYGKLKASDYCGMKGYFPVVDEAHARAAIAVLARCEASDSVKGRILTAIYRKADKMGLDLNKNFDSVEEPCNNNASITVEDALKAFEDAKAKLLEMGIQVPTSVEVKDETEVNMEIQILEAQLEAANEELDSLTAELEILKTQLAEELATRTVDMKMLSGNFEIGDRVAEIENHKARSLDSLRDGLKDLEAQFKIQDFVKNDGMTKAPTSTVENPTLQQMDKKAEVVKVEKGVEENKYKLYDEYNKRVATYGKPEADRWLQKVQKKNGIIPTID